MSVVSLDSNGLITANGAGTATITVSLTDRPELTSECTVTVTDLILGDSNGNGEVNIADAVNTANMAIGNDVEHFNPKAADINGDGRISLADASGTVSIILEQPNTNFNSLHITEFVAEPILIENDNLLFCNPVNIELGETKLLHFELDNNQDLYGFQTDITLPDGLEFILEDNGKPELTLTDRADSTYVSVSNLLSPSLLRFGVFSSSHKPLIGSEGEIFTVFVRASSEYEGGELLINHTLLIDNNDFDVELQDFSMFIDNRHNDSCYIAPFTIGAGETKTICVELDNETPFSGFQTDIILPKELFVEEHSIKLTERAEAGHTLSTRNYGDGTTRVACFSVESKPLTGNNGAILEFDVTASSDISGDCLIELRNQIFSTVNAKEYHISDSSAEVTIDNLTNIGLSGGDVKDSDVEIFTPDGVLVFRGKAKDANVGTGLYLIRQNGRTKKLMITNTL